MQLKAKETPQMRSTNVLLNLLRNMHSDLDKFKYVRWKPDIPYMTINIF